MRRGVVLMAALVLGGCESFDPLPDTNDLCRDSYRCSPQCGTMATGANGDCSPVETGGRTRG